MKKYLLFAVLISAAWPSFAQTPNTGRIISGLAANRPTCGSGPPNAENGDVYNDTDDSNTFKCFGGVWSAFGGGGGGSPSGNQGDLQKKNSGAFGASSINDNGTTVSVSEDAHFKGPNPYFDITTYGARAFSASTTGTITGGTAALSLGAASGFINGDGIVVRGAGATETMSTPSAPTVTASNAASLVGTNITTANSSGATTYQYQIVAVDLGRGYTVASTATSISNGAATLGYNSVTASSWTRANRVVTITTATAHNLITGAQVVITGDSAISGTWNVASATPGGTTFTFNQGQDTRNGAPASGTTSATVSWYMANHIAWSHVAGAEEYLIYGRTSGSMALIGVSYPDNTTLPAGEPLYNTFDDFGATMTTAPALPDWAPATPPGATKNDDLVTTISAGGGTTSLTLAANASNSVSGATVKFDNAPNILAAITAATPNGVVYIPASSGTFVTNSVLNILQFPNPVSIMQAGAVSLGDTLTANVRIIWKGNPQTPQGIPSFGFSSYPTLSSGGAYPLIYAEFQPVQLSYLNISSGKNSVPFVQDENGNIPSSNFDHLNFSLGATDYTGHAMVIRNAFGGDGGFFLTYVDMIPNSGTNTNAPMFINTRGSGIPYTFDHTFLNKRGIYFGSCATAYFDWTYEQGGQAGAPKIFLDNYGGGNTCEITVRNSIEDTTQVPVVMYAPGLSGFISMSLTNGLAGYPVVQGDGGVAVQYSGIAATTLDSAFGQTVSAENSLMTGLSVDGILATSSTNLGKKKLNAELGLGPGYQVFVEAPVQIPPTCAVSSGGSVAVGSYTFQVVPVFATGGEGQLTSSSATCATTTGNQTITISWAAVSSATGYDLYVNGFSFQCAPPWVSGGATTSYVWSSASICGVSAPSFAGTGPTALTKSGVYAPQITTQGTGTFNQGIILGGPIVNTVAAPWIWTGPGGSCGTPPSATTTSGYSFCLGDSSSTAIDYSFNGGAWHQLATSAVPDGNAGVAVTTTPYTVQCDSGALQVDRTTTLRFQPGASVINIPAHTTSGCGGNMTFTLIDDGAGALTINAGGADTFTVVNGSSNTDGATSFGMSNGNFATLNNGSGAIWEVRLASVGSSNGTINVGAAPYNILPGYQIYDASTSSGSPNVTSTAFTFTSSMIGWLAHYTNCVPGSTCNATIPEFPLNSGAENTIIGCSPSCPSHIAILSTNALATITTGNGTFTFGPNDEAGWTLLEAALNAASTTPNCPAIILGGGYIMTKKGHFNSSTCQNPGLGTGDRQITVTGVGGPYATYIAPTQDFDFTTGSGHSCGGGLATNTCFFGAQAVKVQNLGIDGGGLSLTTQTHSVNVIETRNDSYVFNFVCQNWGANDGAMVGFLGNSGSQFSAYMQFSACGKNPLVINGGTSISHSFFGGTTGSVLTINAGATFNSDQNQIGYLAVGNFACPANVNQWLINGQMASTSDTVGACTGGIANAGILLNNANALLRATNLGDAAGGSNTSTGIAVNVSGAKLIIADSVVTSGAGLGIGMNCQVSGAICISNGGNTFTGVPAVGFNSGATVLLSPTDIVSGGANLPSVTGTIFGTSPTITNCSQPISAERGCVLVTEGTGTPSSGTFVLTFNQVFSYNAQVPTCQLGFQNGTGSWNARVSSILTTAATTAMTYTIDNNAVGLTNGSTYGVTWLCSAR